MGEYQQNIFVLIFVLLLFILVSVCSVNIIFFCTKLVIKWKKIKRTKIFNIPNFYLRFKHNHAMKVKVILQVTYKTMQVAGRSILELLLLQPNFHLNPQFYWDNNSFQLYKNVLFRLEEDRLFTYWC